MLAKMCIAKELVERSPVPVKTQGNCASTTIDKKAQAYLPPKMAVPTRTIVLPE